MSRGMLFVRCLAGLIGASAAIPCDPLGAQTATPAAEPLYMPRAIKAAYAKGTRSADGRPGAKYWQNRARYTMTITVAPPDRGIHGTEEIVYANHSPDTLRMVVIKLFLNIHKPGAPRAGGSPDEYLTSGVQIDRFAVNGAVQAWRTDVPTFTWRRVQLPAPLAPDDSVRLAFDWRYDVSRLSNREGMIDPTTFYLAYFYPRVAVYDDYNGWDTMDFTDAQEFYSDFNDYDVTIRAPASYVVWGTGTLVNASEVLQAESLRRYQASLTSDSVVHVATSAELAARSVTAQQPVNAWRFTSQNVPDVAFNVSDHYVWDAASAVVDTSVGRRASVQAAYGFMDEGRATTFEYLINQADMGPQRAATFFKEFRVEDWIEDPSPLGDLPIITPQDVLKGIAYGNNAYGKAALGYLAVKDLLGDATFKRTLHAFMDRWNGKHPIPWDYFNTVNDVAGRNLNWFWNAWFFSNGYVDLGISAARKTAAGFAVTLRNVGGMPAPVDLIVTYADGTTETRHQTPTIWASNVKQATVNLAARKRVRSIALAGGIWMDADPTNDRWTAR